MKVGDLIEVDPQMLRLPGSRRHGADPIKLQLQIARYGKSTAGMPPAFVRLGSDDELELIDGVTRATRVAKLLPGSKIIVEVTEATSEAFESNRTVGETLP